MCKFLENIQENYLWWARLRRKESEVFIFFSFPIFCQLNIFQRIGRLFTNKRSTAFKLFKFRMKAKGENRKREKENTFFPFFEAIEML